MQSTPRGGAYKEATRTGKKTPIFLFNEQVKKRRNEKYEMRKAPAQMISKGTAFRFLLYFLLRAFHSRITILYVQADLAANYEWSRIFMLIIFLCQCVLYKNVPSWLKNNVQTERVKDKMYHKNISKLTSQILRMIGLLV